ncbi:MULTISPECIES: hypothetical protein [Curtobacterium]|uniref:hypothetical protein n=1 Tax=Curtobacterium flaccumfaciens TaxID=2035 RepID=UPI003EE48F0E
MPERTPTRTPTPTSTTPAVTQPESRTVDAGAVAEGATGSATGSGSANVHYRRDGDFAVVVTLDCSACTGTATVTAAGRMSPFGRASAPLTGSFLMDVFKDGAPDQTFIVQATGSWTVTLRSWNDLTPVTGPQSGTGPAVLYIADDVARVHVDYTPAGSGDAFSARVFTVSKATRAFGDSEAFSDDFEADLPGVIAIQTNGTWKVTPLG